jgi:predicted dehydrogenase
MKRIRWAIIGSGGIAAKMAATLAEMPDAELVAVASPTPGRAFDFGAGLGVPAFDSVEEMLEVVRPDAVYVASSNHRHLDDALAAAAAGIPTLCEKPMAVNRADAARMVDAFRHRGVFLMEAMWMRFQPFWDRLAALLAAGAIGTPRIIRADFGFVADPDPARRWSDPAQGGGALLDLGVYPLTFAHLLGGPAEAMVAQGVAAATGVDGSTSIGLRHANGMLSVLDCSILADTPTTAVVSGNEGRIELEAPFHHTRTLSVYRGGAVLETIPVGYEGSGYRFEVDEVHRCLREGLSESNVHPLDDTLAVMGLIDQARALAYSG